MSASFPFEIHGIDDETARDRLREVLNRQRIAGITTRLSADCEPIWDDETDLADFDRELNKDGVQMVWAKVCMRPLAFLRLQAAINIIRGFDVTVEGFLKEPLRRPDRLADIGEAIESGDRAVPIPLIELDREGRLRAFQEGRTRGVAAFYADVREMPVLVFLNTRKDDGQADVPNPPTEFDLQAELTAADPFEEDFGCPGLPSSILALVEEWGTNPCDINTGECARFAREVKDAVPDVTIIDNLEFTAQLKEGPEHVFLECGGRYYDAEAPQGVDDWRDLPFFQQHFTEAELEGAFIKRGEVAKEGVYVPKSR